MMSLTFGLFTQVSSSGPLGPLVYKEEPHMRQAKYQPNWPSGSGEEVF